MRVNKLNFIKENRSYILIVCLILGFCSIFLLKISHDFIYLSMILFFVVISISMYEFMISFREAYQKYSSGKAVIAILTVPIVSEINFRIGNWLLGVKPSFMPLLDKISFIVLEMICLFLIISIFTFFNKKEEGSSIKNTSRSFAQIYGFSISFISLIMISSSFYANYSFIAQKLYDMRFIASKINSEKGLCKEIDSRLSSNFFYLVNESEMICINEKSKRFTVVKVPK